MCPLQRGTEPHGSRRWDGEITFQNCEKHLSHLSQAPVYRACGVIDGVIDVIDEGRKAQFTCVFRPFSCTFFALSAHYLIVCAMSVQVQRRVDTLPTTRRFAWRTIVRQAMSHEASSQMSRSVGRRFGNLCPQVGEPMVFGSPTCGWRSEAFACKKTLLCKRVHRFSAPNQPIFSPFFSKSAASQYLDWQRDTPINQPIQPIFAKIKILYMRAREGYILSFHRLTYIISNNALTCKIPSPRACFFQIISVPLPCY